MKELSQSVFELIPGEDVSMQVVSIEFQGNFVAVGLDEATLRPLDRPDYTLRFKASKPPGKSHLLIFEFNFPPDAPLDARYELTLSCSHGDRFTRFVSKSEARPDRDIVFRIAEPDRDVLRQSQADDDAIGDLVDGDRHPKPERHTIAVLRRTADALRNALNKAAKRGGTSSEGIGGEDSGIGTPEQGVTVLALKDETAKDLLHNLSMFSTAGGGIDATVAISSRRESAEDLVTALISGLGGGSPSEDRSADYGTHRQVEIRVEKYVAVDLLNALILELGMVPPVGGGKAQSAPSDVESADREREMHKASPSERRINAWITERPNGLTPPLVSGETYRLNFNVGVPHIGDLLPATAVIPVADIPAAGLQTEWMVIADGADLGAVDMVVTIDHDTADGQTVALARFRLLVPRDEDSVTVNMALTPNAENPRLHVLIFVRQQLYRSFEIALNAGDAAEERPDPYLPLTAERILALASEMNLAPPFEWTTPPGELTVWLAGGMANVYGDVSTALGWRHPAKAFVLQSNAATIAGHINNVRASAERFRSQHDAYLNAIDRTDLDARLDRWQPSYDWSQLTFDDDDPHRKAWDVVARSPELRDLAIDGYTLFRQMFQRTDLLDWLATLLPGHRLNIVSYPVAGAIPNMPFGLMYVLEPPKHGEPVDPLGFAGLRFRLEYLAHDVPESSKGLVGPSGGHRVNVLYWGSNAADPTLQEADVQRAAWQALPNQRFVPSLGSADPRAEVLDTLSDPKPSPVAILYFFCQCSVGSGNAPELEFTDSFNTADAIRRNDLGVASFADRPLIFANACTTAGADPYVANLLESEFFARDCRGFLGTETKVPIAFASRFAEIFFRFFERRIAKEPLSAGESVAQTRLFLWSRYRNIGGLFYTYVNQYELFMASQAEVEAARRS